MLLDRVLRKYVFERHQSSLAVDESWPRQDEGLSKSGYQNRDWSRTAEPMGSPQRALTERESTNHC